MVVWFWHIQTPDKSKYRSLLLLTVENPNTSNKTMNDIVHIYILDSNTPHEV